MSVSHQYNSRVRPTDETPTVDLKVDHCPNDIIGSVNSVTDLYVKSRIKIIKTLLSHMEGIFLRRFSCNKYSLKNTFFSLILRVTKCFSNNSYVSIYFYCK